MMTGDVIHPPFSDNHRELLSESQCPPGNQSFTERMSMEPKYKESK
jgi:hypothetical protein